jgi:hypothetical protein
MDKRAQIIFIAFFLAVIGIVPVAQTWYEFMTNPDHRVQMLDLAADLLVTPSKKTAKDAATIDSVLRKTARIQSEIARNPALSPDLGSEWDREKLVGYCDEAKIDITLLKKSAADYNRHQQAGANRWAGKDTLKPYYRSLVQVEAGLDALLQMARSADGPEELAPLAAALEKDAGAIKRSFDGRRGVAAYVRHTGRAFRRILVGSDYLRPYEKEMEKSSIFANAVRPWMLAVNYAVFGDLGSKGIPGEDGWLFYRPDVEYLVKPYVLGQASRSVDPNDAPITESIIDTIVSFKNQLSSRGIGLLFVIMPTKPSIYPDLLNPSVPSGASGIMTHSLRMIRDLRAASVETVDLFAAFARERQNDAVAAESLYLRTDTHFKYRGVRTTARVIAERVRQYSWFTEGAVEYVVDTVTVPRKGDIAEMIGLPQKIMPRFPRLFEPEQTRCMQVYRLLRDETGAVADRTLYKDDYARSSILVLGDSFSRMYQTDSPRGAGWIAHLALELGQPVASLVNDGGASTLVREVLARKPNLLRNKKLVVWEVVERDFRFGEKGWKDVKIQ